MRRRFSFSLCLCHAGYCEEVLANAISPLKRAALPSDTPTANGTRPSRLGSYNMTAMAGGSGAGLGAGRGAQHLLTRPTGLLDASWQRP